jgi:hypothetical protein
MTHADPDMTHADPSSTAAPAPAVPPDAKSGLLRLHGLPNRRVMVWALVAAVLVAALCWYFGADLWHSVLLGGVITTVGSISLAGTPARDPSVTGWRDRPSSSRQGARSEVAELSWSLRTNYAGRVDIRAVLRARQLARRRLAPYQVDLNDPADRPRVEALIGTRAYAVLVRRERRPTLRSLVHCLDALDALGTTMPTPAPPKPRLRKLVLRTPRA